MSLAPSKLARQLRMQTGVVPMQACQIWSCNDISTPNLPGGQHRRLLINDGAILPNLELWRDLNLI